MHKYRIYLIIAISLFAFKLSSTSAICSEDHFEAIGACFPQNPKCPNNNILFKDKCYNIENGLCNADELWINGKCCPINCMISCTDGNCENCCIKQVPVVDPNINCPSQPVTPIPVQPVTPIPVEVTTSNPPTVVCPNQPVTPIPVEVITPNPPTVVCPNQPVTPLPPISPNGNQNCCNQCSCTQRTCCGCAQNCVPNCNPPCSQGCSQSGYYTNCKQQTLCPNQQVANPIACNQPTNCGSTQNCMPNNNLPCGQGCSQSCGNTNCIQITPPPPTSNCTQQPVTPCPTLPPMPCTTTSNPIDSTTTTTPTTAPPPPPDPLYKCPTSTILIGKTCHLIYCPRGSIMKDNRCVVIECPEGTFWTGYRCSQPEPMALNVTLFNTVVTNFNHSKPDIILNSTNNIVVNASMTLNEDSGGSNYNHDESEDDSDKVTPPKNSTKCCDVMSPRICESRDSRWHCYSRRYRRCGDFCVKPIIYLRPSRIQARPNCVVMPPQHQDCQHGNCGQLTGGFDCSGCVMGHMERCSYYCYRYACPSQKCGFYDQKQYCSHNAGSYGCQEEDGCYDDWCQ